MKSPGDSNVALSDPRPRDPTALISSCTLLHTDQPLPMNFGADVTDYAGLLPAPITCAALVSLCLGPSPAVADGGGLYLGASGGYTLSSYRHTDLDNALVQSFAGSGDTLVLSGSSIRNEHAPWSVDVGYRLSAYFGLEASYLELGTLKYAGTGTVSSLFGSGPAAVKLDIKSRGPALVLAGALPLTNYWGLEARLGVYEGKTLTQFTASVNGTPSSGSDSKASASLLAGVGTSYVLGGHWVLHIDYTHLNQLGEKILTKSFNVDLLTAGVAYAF